MGTIRNSIKILGKIFFLKLSFCFLTVVADWEYMDFNPYIGYPANWGQVEVDYMFANDPAANMEMGAFIRTPFFWIN